MSSDRRIGLLGKPPRSCRIIGSGVAALLAIALLATACASPARPGAQPTSSASQATSTVGSGDRMAADRWARFSVPELGVTFEFRPGNGTVSYSFHDAPDGAEACADGGPDGALAAWDIAYPEGSDTSGHVFAWIASQGYGPDSGDSIFSRDRWVHTKSGAGRVVFCGKEESVESIGVFELEGGARGLVYRAGDLGEPPFDSRERAAIVNFPEGYNDRFHAINFSFRPPDRFSSSDIERVLHSLRFEKVDE